MISKLKYPRKKSLQGLEKWLTKHKDLYTVESEERGVYYGVDDYKFAVITPYGILFCPHHEVPKLADYMQECLGNSLLRQEVLDVFQDLQERNKISL